MSSELDFSERSINEKLVRLGQCKDLKTIGLLVAVIQSEFKFYTSLVKLKSEGEIDQKDVVAEIGNNDKEIKDIVKEMEEKDDEIDHISLIPSTIQMLNVEPQPLEDKELPLMPSTSSSQSTIVEVQSDCIIEASVLYEINRKPATKTSPMRRLEKKTSSLKFWKV